MKLEGLIYNLPSLFSSSFSSIVTLTISFSFLFCIWIPSSPQSPAVSTYTLIIISFIFFSPSFIYFLSVKEKYSFFSLLDHHHLFMPLLLIAWVASVSSSRSVLSAASSIFSCLIHLQLLPSFPTVNFSFAVCLLSLGCLLLYVQITICFSSVCNLWFGLHYQGLQLSVLGVVAAAPFFISSSLR